MKVLRLITVFAIGAISIAQVSHAQRKKAQKSAPANAVPTAQAEWKTAASSEDYVVSYSPKRLARVGRGIVRVWTKRQKIGSDRLMMELNEYDCGKRATRTLKTVMYDSEGKMVITDLTSQLYSTPNAEWEFVIPDTMGEKELLTICRIKR